MFNVSSGEAPREEAMEHSPIVARLRVAYEQWAASKGQSVDCWLELCADNIAISAPVATPEIEFSQPRQGQHQVGEYFAAILNDWRMNAFEMSDFIEQGNRIVAIGSCSWTHKRTDKRVDTPKIDVWTFEKGKATTFCEFYDTAKVIAAATRGRNSKVRFIV
jgi:ketosteroid isomerase-like protein